MPEYPIKSGLSHRTKFLDGLSVVMVSYWTGPVLRSAIKSVLARDQEGVVELIVVDNGNPPAVTAELVRLSQEESRLTLLSGHSNVGFAQGCNIGASRASGRYLLLLNPDCWLRSGTIPALLAEAKELGDDWMLGCRVVNPDGSDQRGSRRALLTPCTAFVETFRLDRLSPRLFRHYRLNQHDNSLPEDTIRIPAISGACMMLPTTTFHTVSGMDERYFLHVDDLDFCFRLNQAGIPVYFTPHAEVVHHAGTSRINPVRVEWYKTCSFLRYFSMHYSNLYWLPLLGPLVAGTLIRFGIKTLKYLLLMAWNKQTKANGIRN